MAGGAEAREAAPGAGSGFRGEGRNGFILYVTVWPPTSVLFVERFFHERKRWKRSPEVWTFDNGIHEKRKGHRSRSRAAWEAGPGKIGIDYTIITIRD